MTPDTDSIEREVKFAADLSFELPDLRKAVGSTVRLPEQSLRTAYFDTNDLRLWRRGLTLRHRKGEGGQAGKWTLKLPEKGDGRSVDRTELSWAGGQDDIPEEAQAILRGIVRRATLGRTVVLESTRQRLLLRDKNGTPLGEIDDDVVTVAKGTQKGLRFRQIEVEFGNDLLSTDVEDRMVRAVVKRIRRAGAHAEQEQKFAKSLGPEAASAGLSPLGRKATLSDVVGHSIADGLDRLLDYDYRLRLQADDPPVRAVHQARVASRRLRSDLKTYSPLLDPVWLKNTTAELKWLGTRLGQVRDADVLADNLEAGRPDRRQVPGDEEVRVRLAAQRRAFSAELAEAMKGDRYLKLLERLAAAAQTPPMYISPHSAKTLGRTVYPQDRARDVVPTLVLNQWKVLQRREHKGGAHPADHQLHRIRIAAKQLRYAAEAAAPVIGRPALRTARRASDLQTILGEHHDAVAAEAWLHQVALDGTSTAGFAAGLQVAEERRRQKKLRRTWRSAWYALDSKKATAWLRPQSKPTRRHR